MKKFIIALLCCISFILLCACESEGSYDDGYQHGYDYGETEGYNRGYEEGFDDAATLILDCMDEEYREKWWDENIDIIMEYDIQY